MSEFKNNSHAAKSKNVSVPEKEEPQIEAVVTDGVKVSKPTRWRRFRRSFIAGDASSVGEHIFWNLMIPSAKDALFDAGSTFLDMMIFGEKRHVRSSGPSNVPTQGIGSTSKINYGTVMTGNNVTIPPNQHQLNAPQGRFSPNDIVVPTRAQAESILAKMFETLERYNAVTVANLYSTVGVTADYLDHKWGWTNLDSADVKRVRNGVLLVLPPPTDLGV